MRILVLELLSSDEQIREKESISSVSHLSFMTFIFFIPYTIQ